MRAVSLFKHWLAAFWRAPTLSNALRMVVVFAMLSAPFAALVIYQSREPARTVLARPAQTISMAPSAQSAEMRIGHLLFSPLEGDFCKRVLFDNKTGALEEAGQIDCSKPAPPEPVTSGADRMQGVSKAFKK